MVPVVALIIALAINYSSNITYLLDKDPTFSGRMKIWQYAALSIMKHPIFGYGYSAFWIGTEGRLSDAASTGLLAAHAHNAYLEIWLELGAVGFGLFFYSIVKTIRNALFCLYTSNSSYVAWCVCVFCVVIVANIDESGLIMAPHCLPWILYVLACVGLSEEAKSIRLRRIRG
jgi:O-antigen ligase